MEKKIIIATHNRNKVREFKEILEPLGYQVYSGKDFNITDEPCENGRNYQENAYIKAKFLAEILDMCVISDDSGIEIDALGEAFPGIHSARWASSISDDYRVVDEYVLSLLKGKKNRSARYHCCICLLKGKNEKPIFFDGICEGEILEKIGGYNGFGYDPIFKATENGLCFGDVSDEEKNKVSHRSKALKGLLEYLKSSAN